MFPYTVKYTESEYDMQNEDLLYKIHPKCPKYFQQIGTFGKTFEKNTTYMFFILLYFFFILHILYIS